MVATPYAYHIRIAHCLSLTHVSVHVWKNLRHVLAFSLRAVKNLMKLSHC